MSKQQISGGLVQQYGQIILGYLAEAIIIFNEMKFKLNKENNNKIIGSGNLNLILSKIENAFGDIVINQEFSEKNNQPVISWLELHAKLKDYLARFNQELNEQSYLQIMNELINMQVLIPYNNLQDKTNYYFVINTKFFQKSEIEKVSVNLETAMQSRLKKFLSNNVANQVLLVLSQTAGLTESELNNIPQALRSSLMFKRFGRGALLSIVRKKGVTYKPYMKTLDALVARHILVEGCYGVNEEFIILNPVLKPFTVITEIIENYNKQQSATKIIEFEVSNVAITPFESMINLGSLGGDTPDLYLFEGFEFGLQGL